jgi:hypothetical protein
MVSKRLSFLSRFCRDKLQQESRIFFRLWIPFLIFLIFPLIVIAQGTYRWVDEKGTIHFADDLTLVPEKYRTQAQPKNPPKESPEATRPSPAAAPAVAGSQQQDDEESPRKDVLGRSEAWWRAKIKEWTDKLVAAQKSYEDAQTAVRAKEKELTEARFKPESFKRKLTAEKRSLEEKSKEWEIRIDEAKKMLAQTLPREAQDYGADPDWLKLKE